MASFSNQLQKSPNYAALLPTDRAAHPVIQHQRSFPPSVSLCQKTPPEAAAKIKEEIRYF